MIVDDRRYTFSSGRTIAPFGGIIGLAYGEEAVYEGYDGYLSNCTNGEPLTLTVQEKTELADFMIEIWTRWRRVSA